MFERYTERARRALFFARYEASNYGGGVIETEHLLLGLVREQKGYTHRVLDAAGLTLDAMRGEMERRAATSGEKVATSVEIPFSEPTKRALLQTAAEADGLLHSYIGTEHLLLALLRDPVSGAGEIPTAHGLHYDEVRKQIVGMLNDGVSQTATPDEGPLTPTETVAAIDRIKRDVARLASLAAQPSPSADLVDLAERIHHALDRLKPPPSR